MKPTDRERAFADAVRAVSDRVRSRYGMTIVTGPVAEPFKGDLDGAEIVIATGLDPETSLFLLVHLFGHAVQWNVDERARKLGMRMPVNPDERLLDALGDYEREACRYGQHLLHESGVTDLDQWLADHAACDHAYLRHFYVTGERLPFRRFWRDGNPLLEPLPIPGFTPRRWRRRGRAIVV